MTIGDRGNGDPGSESDRDDVPEAAKEEAKILTPEEDAERATRRLDWQERQRTERWPHTNDPLRQPGEPAPARAKRNDAEQSQEYFEMTKRAHQGATMPNTTCETCGNTYDKVFQITLAGETHVFDSFECAIAKLAPVCTHCRCRVIGHGVEAGGGMFCCTHCAEVSGETQTRDRA